jgi:hypothetical protein
LLVVVNFERCEWGGRKVQGDLMECVLPRRGDMNVVDGYVSRIS